MLTYLLPERGIIHEFLRGGGQLPKYPWTRTSTQTVSQGDSRPYQRQTAVVAQEKLVAMLRNMGEERAADWMEVEWTSPKEGRYPLAFSEGPGGR